MAVQRSTHPSADVLKAFALGKLNDSSSEVVLSHLDQCPACRQEVASQSGDDFLNRLRQADPANKRLDALQGMVADLKAGKAVTLPKE